MPKFIKEEVSLWQRLKETKKPVVLYGMGDGADKIIKQLDAIGVKVSDIFASDEFVRGHFFHGIRVKKLSEIEEMYGDFFILVSFAVDYEPMLSKIFSLSEKYETAAPDVPLFGSGIFDLDFVSDNEEKINKAYSLLADEQSRKVFENIINFKISGSLKYLRGITTERTEDLKEIFEFSENESYLDLGAYDGDTVREFSLLVNGQFGSINALEPDRKNFKKLCALAETDKRINALPLAVWDSDTQLLFNDRAGRNSSLKENGRTEVSTVKIDSICGEKGFTFIKMDVEGAERRALSGGRETLIKYKPKLFISAYHRNEDIFDLILLINELNPDYKIYLRKHPYIPAWEVNILAK